MLEGLKYIKSNYTTKTEAQSLRTSPVPPEINLTEINTQHQVKDRENWEPDFESTITHIKQTNLKQATMPDNPQFARKWQSFQNDIRRLMNDWNEIIQECTKTTVVCDIETTKLNTQTNITNTKSEQDTTQEDQRTAAEMEHNFSESLKTIRRSPRDPRRTYAEVVAQKAPVIVSAEAVVTQEEGVARKRISKKSTNKKKFSSEPKKCETGVSNQARTRTNPERSLDTTRDCNGKVNTFNPKQGINKETDGSRAKDIIIHSPPSMDDNQLAGPTRADTSRAIWKAYYSDRSSDITGDPEEDVMRDREEHATNPPT